MSLPTASYSATLQDPLAAEHILGSAARVSSGSPPIGTGSHSFSGQDAEGDVSMDPSSSQLQRYTTSATEPGPPVGTPIKLAPSAAAFRKETPNSHRKGTPVHLQSAAKDSPKSVIGQVSDLIFGW